MSAAIEAIPASAPDFAAVKRRQQGGDANVGTHLPPRPGRQRVKSAASAAVAVSAFGLFLAWMGGEFREKVNPGELPPARPSAAGRTIVLVERVRGVETATAVGSVQPKRRTEVASQLLATVLDVRV